MFDIVAINVSIIQPITVIDKIDAHEHGNMCIAKSVMNIVASWMIFKRINFM